MWEKFAYLKVKNTPISLSRCWNMIVLLTFYLSSLKIKIYHCRNVVIICSTHFFNVGTLACTSYCCTVDISTVKTWIFNVKRRISLLYKWSAVQIISICNHQNVLYVLQSKVILKWKSLFLTASRPNQLMPILARLWNTKQTSEELLKFCGRFNFCLWLLISSGADRDIEKARKQQTCC